MQQDIQRNSKQHPFNSHLFDLSSLALRLLCDLRYD